MAQGKVGRKESLDNKPLKGNIQRRGGREKNHQPRKEYRPPAHPKEDLNCGKRNRKEFKSGLRLSKMKGNIKDGSKKAKIGLKAT